MRGLCTACSAATMLRMQEQSRPSSLGCGGGGTGTLALEGCATAVKQKQTQARLNVFSATMQAHYSGSLVEAYACWAAQLRPGCTITPSYAAEQLWSGAGLMVLSLMVLAHAAAGSRVRGCLAEPRLHPRPPTRPTQGPRQLLHAARSMFPLIWLAVLQLGAGLGVRC
jgi:hypothetical protein